MQNDEAIETIAVIGAAVRVPGADDCASFWANLAGGVDSIDRPSIAESRARGASESMISHPHHLPSAGRLHDIAGFDAGYFEIGPHQATILDPQHRMLLELGIHALDDAGYDPDRTAERIGIYSGVGMNSYLMHALLADPALCDAVGPDSIMIGNDKSFGVTRLAYKLNLKGPALCIDTACSTSLVAVHLACRALLTHECDIALAGGVRLIIPHWDGDIFEEGSIHAPDGFCRAFDREAAGTVHGSGGTLLVLRRTGDALAAGDTVRAVVRGTSINNDGSEKVSYSAPSVNRQAEVIRDAMAIADVEPESISYVEAHGTGTSLGDPLEIQALHLAHGVKGSPCALGSVKTNIGHLDVAAGAVGVLKAVLALQHEALPPSLNCPNPAAALDGTRFSVNQTLRPWPRGAVPRRAGISSFGIGGTNAHAVLEEAPPAAVRSARPGPQLLVLSAKRAGALTPLLSQMADRLDGLPTTSFAAAAYTLQVGRRRHGLRRVVVADSPVEAAERLRAIRDETVNEVAANGVAYLFPGQGTERTGMLRDLRAIEPVVERSIAACLVAMPAEVRGKVRYLLDREPGGADPLLANTSIVQPLLFTVSYALAQLWMSWGIPARALIGHSLGEYVAATLAGIYSLEDAIWLVSVRGRVMQQAAPGMMLAISVSEEELSSLGHGEWDLAAVNAPGAVVVSGATDAIRELEATCAEHDVPSCVVNAHHGFHSRLMDAVLEEFGEAVASRVRKPPALPLISGMTGHAMSAEQACSCEYWVEQLRVPVRFADGVTRLAEPGLFLCEMGGGRNLTVAARRCGVPASRSTATLPEGAQEIREAHGALAAMVQAGIEPDWDAYHRPHGIPGRISLPSYPFDHSRDYWPARNGADRSTHTDEPLEGVVESETPADPMIRLWRDLLGDSTIRGDSDFFDLGGDSLLATRLISRVRDIFSVTLTTRQLFECRTPSALAALVSVQTNAAGEVPFARGIGSLCVPQRSEPGWRRRDSVFGRKAGGYNIPRHQAASRKRSSPSYGPLRRSF